ncbi:nucleoside hydrolase [Victivallis sp. Marseille-Q1083]|uniref:nucleoside hydrolase n=1 Tax=Victivallis sp. Marseille-Q1083 TaxID=2717288 RepID=UPI00158956C9|nr:nucleoside hydrolase [Victivallis sp. Marseille-Q1083]
MFSNPKPIPVILDTDIGGDIDDAWALAFLLNCPEVELKMVLTATGDTTYSAKIAAKMLTIAGRTDIPVGIGRPTRPEAAWRTVAAYVADDDLADYAGTVYPDGIAALIELIDEQPTPVTLTGIAALSNVAELLERRPDLAGKVDFVGMHGSIRQGIGGEPGPVAEYNVKMDVAAARKVFQAPWRSMAITPLDTCGLVRLDGELYRRLYHSADPLLQSLFRQYRLWHREVQAPWPVDQSSSTLFDTVAALMTFSRRFLHFKTLPLAVTDDGHTVVRPAAGNRIDTAVAWHDLEAFRNFLAARLLSRQPLPGTPSRTAATLPAWETLPL